MLTCYVTPRTSLPRHATYPTPSFDQQMQVASCPFESAAQPANLQPLFVAFSSDASPAEHPDQGSTTGLRLEVEAPLPCFVANSVAAQTVQAKVKRQPIPAQEAIEEVKVCTRSSFSLILPLLMPRGVA